MSHHDAHLISTYLSQHYSKADRLMLKIAYLLFVYTLLLAFWYNTWAEALIVGGATLVTMHLMATLTPGQALTRITMGGGFMVFAALHIHQAHGMVEFHFGIFAFMAALLYYRDWMPIVAGLVVVAVHHFSFYYFQTQGAGVWIVSDPSSGWWIIFVHAGYAIMEALILIWVAANARREAEQGLELMRVIEAANGDELDLTQRTPGDRQVLQQFNQFAGAIETLVREVKNVSAQINHNGRELGHNTVKIYEHAQAQQRETDMIASAVEELSASANTVSDNANSAAETVRKIEKDILSSAQMATDTAGAMTTMAREISVAADTIDALNNQAEKIGRVMDVIKNVAEQTNLLALNAAIEAARAGDQGRGFAVVADEVRTLARRTQDSTAEISSIIEQLQSGSTGAVAAIGSTRSHVQTCLDNNAQNVALMQQVGKAIVAMSQLNSQMAQATGEQGQAADEINKNVSNILAASEHSVKYANSAATAGKDLLAIAGQMDQLVARFRVSAL